MDGDEYALDVLYRVQARYKKRAADGEPGARELLKSIEDPDRGSRRAGGRRQAATSDSGAPPTGLSFASMRALEFHGPAFARWLEEQRGRPVRYEKVKPGDEQILPPREQRELDALPSGLDRNREA